MVRLDLKKYYFILFKLLLFVALIIALIKSYWFNLILVLITIFMVYFPSILKVKKSFPNKIEILTLVLIYLIIFLEGSYLFSINQFWYKIVFYLIVSFVIGIVGFSLSLISNRHEDYKFHLSPFFMSFFAFCFSISLGVIWQVFRHVMDYFFSISIQNFNLSDSWGFMTIHVFGAFLVSFIGYIYLKTDEDREFLKKLLGINHLNLKNEKRFEKEALNLISKGEGEKIEFKETLRYNIHTKQFDKAIVHSTLKNICAFLNTKGGTLFVGVSDDGEIKGVKRDDFVTNDKYLLFLNNHIKKQIGSEFIPFISYDFHNISGEDILIIKCKESDREVFLKNSSDNEEYYIRVGSASTVLEGSKLIGYIERKFRK